MYAQTGYLRVDESLIFCYFSPAAIARDWSLSPTTLLNAVRPLVCVESSSCVSCGRENRANDDLVAVVVDCLLRSGRSWQVYSVASIGRLCFRCAYSEAALSE